jgi:chromate transport protein ChrA
MRFGGLSWMQAVFYGVGAAVIGIIAMSAKKKLQEPVVVAAAAIIGLVIYPLMHH